MHVYVCAVLKTEEEDGGNERLVLQAIFGARLLHESLRTKNLTISNIRCDESLRTRDESSSASDKGKEGSCKELHYGSMCKCFTVLLCVNE